MLDAEVADEHADLIPYLETFSHMVHPRYGYYVHYPESGGYDDQPCRDMWIYDVFMDVFRKVLKEQAEKH